MIGNCRLSSKDFLWNNTGRCTAVNHYTKDTSRYSCTLIYFDKFCLLLFWWFPFLGIWWTRYLFLCQSWQANGVLEHVEPLIMVNFLHLDNSFQQANNIQNIWHNHQRFAYPLFYILFHWHQRLHLIRLSVLELRNMDHCLTFPLFLPWLSFQVFIEGVSCILTSKN